MDYDDLQGSDGRPAEGRQDIKGRPDPDSTMVTEGKPQPPFDDKQRLHWELTKDLQRDNVQAARVSEIVRGIVAGSSSWQDFDIGIQIAIKDQRNSAELNGLLYIRSQARRLKGAKATE